jgi:hypothetical protein
MPTDTMWPILLALLLIAKHTRAADDDALEDRANAAT